MNKHDKEALRLLKLLQESISGMIDCMEIGDTYNPTAIGGIIDINLLFKIREELALARAEDATYDQTKK